MTYENLIYLLKNPDKIEEEHQAVFRELVEKYPYFGIPKWLYLKSLQVSNSIYYNSELRKTALHVSNRRNLFFFIHPEEKSAVETEKDRKSMSGSYFDMIDIIENKGENERGALQALAERLKAARELMQSDTKKESGTIVAEILGKDPAEQLDKSFEAESYFEEYEAQAKLLIKEKKIEEAIVILEKLNLINPKKSIYFADQIRFLKKIIKN